VGAAVARRHRWTVVPTLVELSYITGVARIGTPSSVDTPGQLVMAVGAAAILCGMLLLWRGPRRRPPRGSSASARWYRRS
jgi:hypothetical protein